MHIDWITADRSIPLTIHFQKQENSADDLFSCSDFCKELRVKSITVV